MCFEQYLFTKCGPNSQPSFNYKLWRMLRKLSLTKEPKKRDALAVQIHQKFLYLGAKRFIQFPDLLLKQIDNTAAMCRPTSPLLKALTEFSSSYLQTTVNKFLNKTHDVSVSLLPPLHNNKRWRTKVCLCVCNSVGMWLFTCVVCC